MKVQNISHRPCYTHGCNTNKDLLHIKQNSSVFVLVGHRAHDVRIRENSGTDNSREVAPGKRIVSRQEVARTREI